MKKYNLLLILLACLLIKAEVQAQNVGIGTTNPTNKLEIKSSTANTSGLRFTNLTSTSTQSVSNNLGLSVDANGDVILVPASGNSWLLAGNSNATATSFLGTTNAFDLIFKVANLEYMRILNASGNVGIGTATPTEKLDVAGNIKFSGALMPNNIAGSTGQVLTSAGVGVAPTWVTIPITTVSNTIIGNNLTTTVNGVTGTAVILPAPPATTNVLASSVNTLTSTVDGVVATAPIINTISNGLIGNNLTTTVNGVVSTNLDLSPIISNDWKLIGNAGTTAGTNFLGTTDAQDVVFKTNNVENLRILTANGNVGVGTNAPSERLVVNGKTLLTNGYSATNGALVYKNTTDYLFLGPVSGSTNQGATLALYGTTNNEAGTPNPGGIDLSVLTASPAVRILTNGNVGVSNTTPTEKLDVVGNVKLSGALMPNNLAGTLGNVLLSSGVGIAPTWLATGVTGQVLTSAGVGVVPFWATNNNWNILGNAGTTTATNFMGTTDNVNVIFKRFNVRAGLLNVSSTSFGVGALNPASTGGFNTALGANSMLNNAAGAFNTAVGVNTLIQNTAGVGNIAVGYTSMLNNTLGNYNTAIGYESVYNNTSGTDNVGVGRSALYSNTTGVSNSASGNNSLLRNTTGNYNVAMGENSLRENVLGNYNTSIGMNAMYNSLGDNNTAIGSGAGTGNILGSSNTFVGFFAEPTGASFTNATAIGNQAKVGASNSLVLGGTGAYSVNVGIGTTTPSVKLEVSQGTIKNTNNTFSLIESHSYSNTGGHAVFIGLGAGGTEVAPTYPSIGKVLSSFIGRDAIDGLTVANYGGADMYAITTENYSATNKGTMLRFSTTLNATNFVQERMRIDHNGNVGINTLLPAYKLHVRGDIAADDGVYARSLYNVGYSSSAVITDILEPWTDNGFKLYDGNSNSHLHIEAVGATVIQSYSTGGVTKGLLENTSYSDLYLQNRGAYVAIGTMPAVSKLTVTADGADGITIQSTGVDAGDLIFKEVGGFEKSRIYSNPTAGLTGLIITTDLTVVGNIVASGTITPSDARYKENIKPLNSSLMNVLKLRGVTYDMKAEFKNKGFGNGPQIGVIAQEVERIYPQLVNTGTDGYKGVDYSKFTPILIEAIKEQQQRIISLEGQLNQLNTKFDILLKQQQNKK